MEIKVPTNAESVSEATVGKWLKEEGDPIAVDEIVVEVETDKATVEVRSSVNGVLEKILVPTGTQVAVGAVLGTIQEKKGTAKDKMPNKDLPTSAPMPDTKQETAGTADLPLSPAVRKLVSEHHIDPKSIKGSGKGGRILKEDVLSSIAAPTAAPNVAEATLPSSPFPAPAVGTAANLPSAGKNGQKRVRMTQLRKTIATRLKQAQNTAAILTTFNEVDMSAVMTARAKYKDLFEKKNGARLGFMGFFIKACVAALQELPALNAHIEGDEIVYNEAVHMGIAVGTDRGLVVPVLRHANRLSYAEIEKGINEFGKLARDNKLTLEHMTGGTFTISNGGVYGSMLSTPILNTPQSGILGMHKIQDRAVVVDGKIEIRPIMYLALSYDHRIVDGREAVTFLVIVKSMLENPERLILGV